MKTKIFLLSVLFGFIYLSGCDDTIDSIGVGIQPDENKIEIYDLSLNISGKTIRLDSIYIKSMGVQLGNIDHPIYGAVKGEYACQFYPSAEFVLDSMIRNDIDSVKLQIMYLSCQGDSLTPMEVTSYPIETPLKEDYYTGINLAQYANMQSPWGKQIYTARDLNISDEENIANHYGSNPQYKTVSVTLPKEFGSKILEEYKKGKSGALASPEAFIKFFPGLYITPTFGSGCLINVEKTSIFIYYERKQTIQSIYTANDTVVDTTAYAALNVTKEVLQLSNYITSNEEKLLAADPDKMYLKTPAGLYSQLTIPISEIIDSIGDRKFSNVHLTISTYPKEDWKYAWKFPGTGEKVGMELERSKLLLIEKDSIVSFFENQKVADNQTSYYAIFDNSTSSYVFKNISNIIQNSIDKAEGKNYKDLELVLIPVLVPYYFSNSDYYNSTPIDYATSHYTFPTAITLKKGGKHLRLKIIAADLEINSQ